MRDRLSVCPALAFTGAGLSGDLSASRHVVRKIDDSALRSLLAVLKLADYLVMKFHAGIEPDHSMEQIQYLAKVKAELMIDSNEVARLEQLLN